MPSTLRVLHLTAASDAGGLSQYILNLAPTMAAQGHATVVAGGRGAWHERFLACPSVEWIDQPLNGQLPALRRAARSLVEYLDQTQVDLLHTHYRRSTWVARRMQREHLRRHGRRIPILYTLHSPQLRLGIPWRWLTDFGDFVHAPSQGARDWLIREARVSPQKIFLIPHGVDPQKFPLRTIEQQRSARQALGLPANVTVAGFVGRLDLKNAGWIVDAAKATPQAIFLIVGEGPERAEIERHIAREALGDRVRMLGERDSLPVYQAIDALLSPSWREGFLLVGAEAMSVGVPVLRTRTGGAEEQIVENITGQTVCIDRKAFAAAAAEFLRNREALAHMGVAAAEHARQRLSLATQVERTVALYRQIAG